VPNVTMLLNTFLTGELTPKMMGLVNSPHYQMGAELMRNYIPLKNGGFRSRPGTRHAVIATDEVCRLIPYTHTDGTVYLLELTNLACHILDATYTRVQSGGSDVSLTTPWPEAELYNVQYAQTNGEMYLVHRSYAPRKIVLSGGTWAISTPTFTGDRTFSTANNYPGVVAFYAGRLYLGSTNAEPLAVFGSKIPTSATGATNYTNFTLGSATPADAIYLLESDMNCRRLAWLTGFGRLLSGTDRSVWMSDGNLPMPSTFDMAMTAAVGVAEIMPQALGGMLLFVGADKTTLRALRYSEEAGGYKDDDISDIADHLIKPGIKDIAVMTNPEPIVWVLLEDGNVVTGNIRATDAGIIASYALQTFGGNGKARSLAVARRTSRDEVCFVVERATNVSIEYLYLDDIVTTAIDDCFYVDNGKTLTPGGATVSGLTWLDTQEVSALGDGAVLPNKTVASNAVTYDKTITKIQIGLPYISRFRNLHPELQINNTWQGKKKQITEAIFRLYNSYGGYVGQDPDNLAAMLFDVSGEFEYGDGPALFTGDKEQFMAGLVDTNGQFYLERRAPLPLTVLAVMLKIEIMEV